MKNKLSKRELLEILRSGDFTIAYHDSYSPSLYKGKIEYEDLPEDEIYVFEENYEGYIPELVALMCELLKGKCITI